MSAEKKTPEPFRNACDEFVYLENLSKDTDTQTARRSRKPAETDKIRNAQESADRTAAKQKSSIEIPPDLLGIRPGTNPG